MVVLRRSEPSVCLGRRAQGLAEELLQPVVAKLPCEVPQPEHVVEGIVHRGPSWRVVAGYGAELRLRVLGHQSGAEDFRPCGACGAPRGHPHVTAAVTALNLYINVIRISMILRCTLVQ